MLPHESGAEGRGKAYTLIIWLHIALPAICNHAMAWFVTRALNAHPLSLTGEQADAVTLKIVMTLGRVSKAGLKGFMTSRDLR